MKTNVRTSRGNFLLSRDTPQTDRQTDKRENQIIQKPSKPFNENVILRFPLKNELKPKKL